MARLASYVLGSGREATGGEAHRAWEKILGEQPTLSWDQLPAKTQQELSDSVQYVIDNPAAPVHGQHNHWRALMVSAGITSANMVEFDKLPWSQQRKAILWRNIIHAIVG